MHPATRECLFLVGDLLHRLAQSVLLLIGRLETITPKQGGTDFLLLLLFLCLVGSFIKLYMPQALLVCAVQRFLIEDVPPKSIWVLPLLLRLLHLTLLH